jgi:TolB-like protein/AraC-like DNA-binding protein
MNVAFSGNSEFIDKLTRITHANLSNEHFGGKELAREAGISRTSLNRRLKTAVNKSVSQLIREIRLQKALEMLQQNEGTASEIAYKVGFGSPTHFNYCFHEFFGFTPGEAKKRARTGNIPDEVNAAIGSPVNDSETESLIPGTGSLTSGTGKKHFQGKKIIWSLISFLLFTLLFTLIYLHQSDTGSGKKSKKSIAVLPFIDDSPDSTNIYFINGISEAITDKLTNIRDLTVTSRNSMERYRNNKTKSTPQIARELGVNYIVEGSGQKIGDQVLISVQLIDARSDKHILSQQFTRKYEDVFNLYSEIALAVAGKIKAVITSEEKESINKPPTSNIAAMEMFIRGDEFNGMKYINREQRIEYVRQAESFYRKAIQLDSAFSDAWMQLGEIYLDKRKTDSALIYTERALQSDNENSKAYLLRGQIYSKKRNADAMEESLKLSLKYDPDNLWAIHWLGGLYYYQGKFANAFEALLKTRELIGNLDPGFSSTKLFELEYNTLHLARCLFCLGFYEKGKKYLDQWLELSEDENWGYNYNFMWAEIINCRFEEAYQLGLKIPENNLCLFYMATDLLFLEKYEEAVNYFQKQIEQNEKRGFKDPGMQSLLGFVFLKLGQKKEADKYFESSEKYVNSMLSIHPESARPEPHYVTTDRFSDFSWFILTSIYAARGEKGKAMKYLHLLRKNYLANDLQVVFLLKNFPMFDNIRTEPEFQDYLFEAETNYLEEHKKVEAILQREGLLK